MERWRVPLDKVARTLLHCYSAYYSSYYVPWVRLGISLADRGYEHGSPDHVPLPWTAHTFHCVLFGLGDREVSE